MSNSLDSLVMQSSEAVHEQGFRRLKLKVGHANLSDDIVRIAAVRKAVGPDIPIAVDANGKWEMGNGKWDLPTAIPFCKRAEDLDIFWLEEPLWFDDVESHRKLFHASSIPIALGEQLYSVDAFAKFISRDAMCYAQPDVTRLAGISEYLRTADLAYCHRMPVLHMSATWGRFTSICHSIMK